MEFINYNRRDVGSSGTASTGIKNVRSITGLKLNLEAGKHETTFSGLGSYLEIDVKHKGTSKKVKIPFFSAYGKDKFINVDGFAFVNPLAKKVIDKVIKANVPTFELTDFQSAATAELNDRINALGTSPAEVAEKARLENIRDNVIANAKKKDSDKLVRDEIKYLEEVIKRGVNLRACSNDTARKDALTKYCNQFERLETLKAQLKKLTWTQKRGIRKLNNKIFKRVTAGAAAVALAAGLVAGQIFEFPKHAWENVESWFRRPKATTTQTVAPTATPTSTPVVTVAPTAKATSTIAPTATPTAVPTAAVAQSSGKYNFDSEMFTTAYQANFDNFIDYREIAENYGFDYQSLIQGYTYVEHAQEMNITGVRADDIQEYINQTRFFLSLLLSTGNYSQLPLRQETLDTMQDSLNENPAAGINFVSQACESKEPLLDMLTIGELESGLIYDQQLLDFNNNVYFKEIEEYKTRILNGTLEIAALELSKVKTLGSYPIA